MLGATMSGYKRLEVNAVDQGQLDTYLAMKRVGGLTDIKSQAVDSEGNVDVSKLDQSYKDSLGVSNLSSYSRRLIESILNEVAPPQGNGAGHEFMNVFRITKDFRTKNNQTSNESIPPFGEEPRESEHASGKAVDVTQLDNLRGTEFTIETTVDAKTGKPVIKDGKPVEEVKELTHLQQQPIDFSLQDDRSAGVFPGAVPTMYGTTPAKAALDAAGGQFGAILNQENAKRGGSDLDFGKINYAGSQNLGEVLQATAGGRIGQALGDASLSFGPNAPLWTGQQALAQATGLPSFGFYGTQLDGMADGQVGFLGNAGREAVGKKLWPDGSMQGALIGNTSKDLFTNAGERTFEVALGDLPLGTLDGIERGNRQSLETHVGRGLVASRLGLYVGQLPLGASTAAFSQALGFQLDALQAAPLAYDTSFDIRGSNATQQVLNGTLAPDEYYRQIGAARLKTLEAYVPKRADAALNLEERPNLVTGLEHLPTSVNPQASSDQAMTSAESANAAARATYVLDRFSFSDAAKQLLTDAKNGTTSADRRFILNDDEFQAWLIDHAYAQGYDANQQTKVSRFLAADTDVFYDTGTDQVAKAIGTDNTARAALRSYFRTGVMPTLSDKVTPAIDVNAVVGKIGLRSRADFEAIFRADAPVTAFEMAGRRELAAAFGSQDDTAALAKQAVAPSGTADQVRDRLAALKTATSNFAAVSSGDVRNQLIQAGTVIDQLGSSVATAKLGKGATPQAWVGSLANLYQVGQLAASTATAHTQEYRQYALALAGLADGDPVDALSKLGSTTIAFSNPLAFSGLSSITGLIDGSMAPNTAIRNLGNLTLSRVNGMDSATSGLLYDLLGAATTQRNASLTDIRSQLVRFATDHADELIDAGSPLNLPTVGFDLNGAPVPLDGSAEAVRQARAEAMIRLMVQGAGSPSGLKLGGNEVDGALGIRGYQVSQTGYGSYGMLSSEINGTVDAVMQQALNNTKLMELLTNQTNAGLTLSEQGNLYGAAALRYVSRLTGLPINTRMLTDPNYSFSVDEGINILESLTGQSISSVVASSNIPIVGTLVGDRAVLNSFLKGEVFDGNSAFWKNQSYLPHIEQLASQAGIPSGLVRTLFDRTLTDDQRTAALGQTFKGFAQAQLTPDRINEVFGLSGDFAIVGGSISGALGILLDDSNADKGAALQQLGQSIGDRYFASNFGTSISWLWNEQTPGQEKIAIGLDALTRATNLDPAIGSLASSAYRTFFVGDGIDTDTVQGRRDLAQLVGSFGAAANLPPEVRLLASAGLQGNFQDALVATASQSFIDNQLAPYGITVPFADMYHAFIGPSEAAQQLASATAWNEVIHPSGLAPEAENVGNLVQITNPTTGEKIAVDASTAQAYTDRTNALLDRSQQQAQQNIQYALGDSLINQALSSQAGSFVNAQGITRAFMQGDTSKQVDAFASLASQLAGSQNGGLIFGSIETAKGLGEFFGSNATAPSAAVGGQLDGWFAQATGVPVPAGTASAMLSAAKTGDTAALEALGDPSKLVGSFGGYLDNTLGLPGGTTQLASQAYQALSGAQTAVDLAEAHLFNVSGGADALEVLGAQKALENAQLQLQLTTAGLVSTGVNLLFGKQIAAVDSALGLPPGTTSMLVTAGITSLMVPGIAFATLASTVFLPALAGMLIGSLLSGGGLGGLFGGGTKKITRKEKLWSYHVSDPAVRPNPKGYDTKTEVMAANTGPDKDLGDSDKKHRGSYLKPSTELDRGDWPEEAWFPEVKLTKEGNVEETDKKPEVIAPGKDIALLTDKELPLGVFRGNTQQQFLAGSKIAARSKVNQLLDDLLTINTRLGTRDSTGQLVDDPNVFPAEIWTHNQLDVQAHEGQINVVYGQGKVGSYQDWIKNGYRRGVGFDSNISLLVRWVHWQY